MEVFVKRFHELTVDQLYALLQLRVAIFVVEQECPYPELDDRDQAAVHVWLEEDGKVLACARVMDRGVENEYVSIGRVVTAVHRSGLGTRVMTEAIRAAVEYFNAGALYLEAQEYAVPFYERFGFRVVSEPFIMDGIPHKKMIRPAEDD
jgi:ElaA protein